MEISAGTFKIDAVQNVMANDDLVAATLHFSAQKPNGQHISMNGVDLMKIQNGQIKEVISSLATKKQKTNSGNNMENTKEPLAGSKSTLPTS